MNSVGVWGAVAVWVAFGFGCAAVATRKGRSEVAWLFTGFLFGIFALVAILILPSRAVVSASDGGEGAVDPDIEVAAGRLTPAGIAGLVLAIAGAVAMVIAVFLPYVDESSSGFLAIAENTLIQSSDGVFFLIPAALIVAGSLVAIFKHARGWLALPMLASIAALGFALFLATDETARTLYPLNGAGQPDSSLAGQVASPGIGIWLAAISATLALIGSLVLLAPQRRVTASEPATEADEVHEPAALDELEWLERLARLHDTGALTDQEFTRQKEKILTP